MSRTGLVLLTGCAFLLAGAACGGEEPNATSGDEQPKLATATTTAPMRASNSKGQPTESREGPLTLEEYFERMDAIMLDLDQALDEVKEEVADEFIAAIRAGQSEDDATFVEAVVPYTRVRLGAENEALRRAVEEMTRIRPPAEAALWHASAILASGEVIREREAYVAALEEVDPADGLIGLDAVDAEFDMDTAGERLEDACYGLEDLADANTIAANLECSILSLTY